MFKKYSKITEVPVDVLYNPDFKKGNFSYIKSVNLKIASQVDSVEASKEAEVIKDGDNTEFDLEAEVREHPDFLFVKCFAIKANETNDNGDWFSTDELKKATHTFVGVPCFVNHNNTDVEQARGKVVHSWYDNERDGIMIISRVDAVAYPDLARGIKKEYMTATSMGTSVEVSICSVCHNAATQPIHYCSCVKENKHKKLSGTYTCQYHKNGEKEKCPICGCKKGETKKLIVKDQEVHEKNYGLKFIENSFVVQPACHDCGITEVIDTSEFLKKVAEINASLPKLLKVASTHPIACSDQSCMSLLNSKDLKTFDQALHYINTIADNIKELVQFENLQKQASNVKINGFSKFAGEKELNDLKTSLDLISNVCKTMIDQKDQVDLEYLEDLTKTMSGLQEVIGELSQMGYGNLPSPDGTSSTESPLPTDVSAPVSGAETAPAAPVGAPPGLGGSKVTSGPAMGGIGNVTSPAMASSKRINLTKALSNVLSLKKYSQIMSDMISDKLIDVNSLDRSTQGLIKSLFGKKTNFVTKTQLEKALSKKKDKRTTKSQLKGKVPPELWEILNRYFSDDEEITEKIILEKMNSIKGNSWHVMEQEWSGPQRFRQTKEKVVPIHLSSEKYMELYSDPILKKFLLLKTHHFPSSTDPIGWALISPGQNEWVINQIQSDIIPQFIAIKQNLGITETKISNEEVITRLKATGRGSWVPTITSNEQLMNHLMNNPNEINQLPTHLNTEEEIQHYINQETQGIRPEQVNVSEKDEKTGLTPSEISYIDQKLSHIINGWPNIVMATVLQMARQEGIENVYMNTSDTISKSDPSAGGHEGKRNFFYEQLPSSWGFKKQIVNLRGKDEELWHRKANKELVLKIKIGN